MFRFKHQYEGDDPPRIRPGLRPVRSDEKGTGMPNTSHFAVFLLILLTVGVILIGHHLDFGDKGSPTVINEDGEEVLSPERQAKLDRELEEFDQSVQYALKTTLDGYYPCFTCPDGSPTIFLYENEVWKYGSTRKGEEGRYPTNNYGAPNLRFVGQFYGNEMECRKREKIMIYNYPLLPEAKKRKMRLFRPPGNRIDN